MNKLIFYSNTNSPGKKDAEAAFAPEALAFAKYYNVPSENVVGIDCINNNAAKRRAIVLEKLKLVKDIGLLMFFGHGWVDGIQFGFTRKYIPELVGAINFNPEMKVGLFACSTAENDTKDNDVSNIGSGTDGGFADKLRDALVAKGHRGWIDAHKTAGHCSWNPYVVRFYSEVEENKQAGIGGGWIVIPMSKQWKRWVSALNANKLEMRYRFLTTEESTIHTLLDTL